MTFATRSSTFIPTFASLVLLVSILIGCNVKVISPGKYFDGPYRQAAEKIDSGDEAGFRATISHLDVNAPGRKDMTLLWYAILRKNYAAIRDLIAAGYQPDEHENPKLGTPLYAALEGSDVRILQAMLDGGLSPNFLGADDTNMLQRSIYGDEAFARIRLLVERGANVNLRDSIGGTVLLDVIEVSKPDIAIYLVEHGADLNAHLTNGVSIAWAVQGSIDDFSPDAKRAPITSFTTDDDGKLTSTVEVPPAPGLSPEGQALLQKYKQLRALMIEKGVKFPPDPPEKLSELGEHQ